MSIVNLIQKNLGGKSEQKKKKQKKLMKIDTSTFFEGRENAIHLSAVDFSFVGD